LSFPRTLQWQGDARSGRLTIIDQTRLPAELTHLELTKVDALIDAIKRLCVRGAPAIGVAGAYGCVLALREGLGDQGIERLANARPTAVNLRWAVERVRAFAKGDAARALEEARKINAEDIASCEAIGRHGASLIKSGMGVHTHCNAGALATSGMGTALAPLYVAHAAGVKFKVFADETRPLLQGARLTAWELAQAGIDVTVIGDDMAGIVLREKKSQLVITGADRIALNGDTANKVGTYSLAMMAKALGAPFYIAAPRSTFDAATKTGADIPIEERNENELRQWNGAMVAPAAAHVFNPAFDVTPAELIAGFITDAGIFKPKELAAWLKSPA
jgi:methylthioribose-1-phosphate isomerase